MDRQISVAMQKTKGRTTAGVVRSNRSQRRRKYFVDMPMQMRIAKQFTVVTLLTLLLVSANFHVVMELSSIYASYVLQPGNSNWVEHILVWGHGIGLFIISIAIFFLISVFYSHRFAGPNFNIVRALNRLGNKDLDVHVKLRSNDYLQEIASALNKATGQWRKSVTQMNEAVQALKDCSAASNDPCARAKIEEMQRILDDYNLGK